jgi:hypothetical protein
MPPPEPARSSAPAHGISGRPLLSRACRRRDRPVAQASVGLAPATASVRHSECALPSRFPSRFLSRFPSHFPSRTKRLPTHARARSGAEAGPAKGTGPGLGPARRRGGRNWGRRIRDPGARAGLDVPGDSDEPPSPRRANARAGPGRRGTRHDPGAGLGCRGGPFRDRAQSRFWARFRSGFRARSRFWARSRFRALLRSQFRTRFQARFRARKRSRIDRPPKARDSASRCPGRGAGRRGAAVDAGSNRGRAPEHGGTRRRGCTTRPAPNRSGPAALTRLRPSGYARAAGAAPSPPHPRARGVAAHAAHAAGAAASVGCC